MPSRCRAARRRSTSRCLRVAASTIMSARGLSLSGLGHHMVFRVVRVLQHGDVAARSLDRLGLHRHPAVGDDDDKVEDQPESHDPMPRGSNGSM